MPRIECGFEPKSGLSGSKWLAIVGPTVHVKIGFDPNHRMDSENLPALPDTLHPALVDTGASESCIDSALAEALKLPVVDRKPISGALGPGESDIYVAQVYVPNAGTISGRFAGVHLLAGGQPHYALLGRLFLLHFEMLYNGTTGAVSLVSLLPTGK